MKAVSDMKLAKAIRNILGSLQSLTDNMLQLFCTKDDVKANHYTKEEIDEKFSNVSTGGSAGMNREFELDRTEMPSNYGKYGGTRSKFYTFTIADQTVSGAKYYTTLTVDYRGIVVKEDGKSTVYHYSYAAANGEKVILILSITKIPDESIAFRLSIGGSQGLGDYIYLTKVCGYY